MCLTEHQFLLLKTFIGGYKLWIINKVRDCKSSLLCFRLNNASIMSAFVKFGRLGHFF